MRHRLTGILAPRQVRSRRARLLARVPLPPFVPLRLSRRRGPAGLVIQRRRQRRIPRVPGRRPLQSRQPLLQLGDPRSQRCVLRRQHRDELTLQRRQRIPGSIQRPSAHGPPSSGLPPALRALGRPTQITKGQQRAPSPTIPIPIQPSGDLNAYGWYTTKSPRWCRTRGGPGRLPAARPDGWKPAASRSPNAGTRQPIGPSAAVPNTEVCVPASAVVVAGHMSATLRDGVMR
jgi:hypothetical protein